MKEQIKTFFFIFTTVFLGEKIKNFLFSHRFCWRENIYIFNFHARFGVRENKKLYFHSHLLGKEYKKLYFHARYSLNWKNRDTLSPEISLAKAIIS